MNLTQLKLFMNASSMDFKNVNLLENQIFLENNNVKNREAFM